MMEVEPERRRPGDENLPISRQWIVFVGLYFSPERHVCERYLTAFVAVPTAASSRGRSPAGRLSRPAQDVVLLHPVSDAAYRRIQDHVQAHSQEQCAGYSQHQATVPFPHGSERPSEASENN